MIHIQNQRYLQLFVSIVLIIVILFNFSIQPVFAEPFTLTAISLKVLATILASMGLLTFVVAQDGGLDSFYEDFRIFLDVKKSVANVASMFYNVYKESLINNVKMKISNIASWIREFVLEKYDAPLPGDLPYLPNAFINDYKFQESTWYYIKNSPQRTILNIGSGSISGFGSYDLAFSEMISANYKIFVSLDGPKSVPRVGIRYDPDAYLKSPSGVSINHEQNISSVGGINYIDNYSTSIRYDINLSVEKSIYQVVSRVINISTGEILSHTVTGYIPPLVMEGVGVLPNEINVPESLPVPYGLALPLEGLLNQSEVIGNSIDALIEMVASIDLDYFLDRLLEMPKFLIDAIPQPTITTDVEGVITDVLFPKLNEIELENKEQTGILQAIFSLLQGFFEKLEELLKRLFLPSDTFITDKVMGFQNNLNSKLPTPDTGFVNILKTLEGKPIPDGYYRGHKILDASYINNLSGTIKSWQRWFYYILIGLYGMNNTYKLIRGGSVISSGKESSKE